MFGSSSCTSSPTSPESDSLVELHRAFDENFFSAPEPPWLPSMDDTPQTAVGLSPAPSTSSGLLAAGNRRWMRCDGLLRLAPLVGIKTTAMRSDIRTMAADIEIANTMIGLKNRKTPWWNSPEKQKRQNTVVTVMIMYRITRRIAILTILRRAVRSTPWCHPEVAGKTKKTLLLTRGLVSRACLQDKTQPWCR